MHLGQKQRAILEDMQEKGFTTQDIISKTYNIKKYEEQMDKVEEFVALGWIKRHSRTNKLLIGDKFPYEELDEWN